MYKPNNIQIHTTTRCNLNCDFCIKGKRDIPDISLSMDTFTNYVDRCLEFGIRNFELTPCVGEPLCDPHMLDRVEYLNNKDIDSVYFYTNLHLMDDMKFEVLSSFDKFKVYVSVYGDEGEFVTNLVQLLVHYPDMVDELHMRFKDWRLSPRIALAIRVGLMGDFRQEQIIDKTDNFDWAGNMDVERIEWSVPECNGRRGVCHFAKVDNGIFPNGDITLCHWFDMEKKMIIGTVNDLQETYREGGFYQQILFEQEEGFYRSMCKKCEGYQGVDEDDPVI